jgi:hypothetical protein
MQVSLMRGRVGINKHGPKLEAPEAPASITNALLHEENRPAGTTANQQNYKQHQRNQEWQRQQNKKDIQGALPV